MLTLVAQPPAPSHVFSDHCSILFDLTTTKPLLARKKVSSRVTKSIDIPAFMNDISISRLCLDPRDDVDLLVGCYNTTLSSLFNRYAPIKTRFVTIRKECLSTRRRFVL